jgi:hypothetical protein
VSRTLEGEGIKRRKILLLAKHPTMIEREQRGERGERESWGAREGFRESEAFIHARKIRVNFYTLILFSLFSSLFSLLFSLFL